MRHLVYRIYPVILWVIFLAIYAPGFLLTKNSEAKWTLFIWPIPTAIVSMIIMAVIAASFPKIRFLDESEIDGLGHVHQPGDVIVPLMLIAFLLAIVAIIRR